MPKHHVCVWIDQRQAKIFEIDVAPAKSTHDDRLTHHLHAHTQPHVPDTPAVDHALLAEVAKALFGARAILILGPGQARTVLAGYLNEHNPRLAAAVWGIEAADHPTDAQLVARARAFFTAADRMHA